MGEHIYDKALLRKRVIQFLKDAGTHQTSAQVALGTGSEFWAVEQALEDAYQARELTFTAGMGWYCPAKTLSDAAESGGRLC